MRQGQDNRQMRIHGTCAIGAAVLLVTALVATIPPCATVSNAAGPAASGGARAARGEIVPLEQTRTLYVAANMWYGGEEQCDIEDEDAADDFGDYDNMLIADCTSGHGEAGQQSSIASTFLTADGYTYAHGSPGGGVFADGTGESVFEVVFDSSTTQWCTLSGEISAGWTESGWWVAQVVLTGPNDVVLFEAQLENETTVIAFDEELLLPEGGPYTLRAASSTWSEFDGIHNDYSVLLELAGEGNVDGDGDVDTADLLALLAAWGPCEDCPEDIDGDGDVDTADLLLLLAHWG
jgi:hypothetical protein